MSSLTRTIFYSHPEWKQPMHSRPFAEITQIICQSKCYSDSPIKRAFARMDSSISGVLTQATCPIPWTCPQALSPHSIITKLRKDSWHFHVKYSMPIFFTVLGSTFLSNQKESQKESRESEISCGRALLWNWPLQILHWFSFWGRILWQTLRRTKFFRVACKSWTS